MRSLLLAVLLPSWAFAQLPTITPGSRVRVLAPSLSLRPIIAVVQRTSTDSLWLLDAKVSFTLAATTSGQTAIFASQRIGLPDSVISEIHVSHGKSRRRGAAKGLAYGAVLPIAFAIGALVSERPKPTGTLGPNFGLEFAAAVSAVVLVPPAVLIGYFVGSERWSRVYSR
jgi:hypothetical protein